MHVASGVPMGVCRRMVMRIAASGVLLLAVPSFVSLATAQPAGGVQESVPAAAAGTDRAAQSPADLPDSPGALLAQSQAQNPLPNSQPASGPQSSTPPPGQQAQPPQNPVGTAAAEPTHAAGIAASQPAGVAIAPAKQHRVRTIVIRVGAIIGAGVAVGTVVALTAATSGKPPGAH
jgi:hypothetical protein